jgi:YesN/AraC family two-component response regulator
MRARIHVLVIDDDEDVQANLSTWLQAAGHEVTIVGTGEAGIEATSQVRFDVVLSELKLPGIDGVQMLRQLRDQQKSVPVVFFSGQATATDIIRALREYGGFDFLIKPLADLSKITLVIERAVTSKMAVHTHPPDEVSSQDAQGGEPLIRQVLALIEAQFRETIGLSEISLQLGYSPAYLTNLLQRETGRTIQQWIIRHRLEFAEQLLRTTDWSVVRIASEVGYASQTHFGRQFRHFSGMSPSAWRKHRALEENRPIDGHAN